MGSQIKSIKGILLNYTKLGSVTLCLKCSSSKAVSYPHPNPDEMLSKVYLGDYHFTEKSENNAHRIKDGCMYSQW